jgi:hypothetical protein
MNLQTRGGGVNIFGGEVLNHNRNFNRFNDYD